ncbi:MAG: CrcB family protein [Marmoricola sp.]
MIKLLPWVALGGAVGAMGRHGVDVLLPAGAGFPWGTLLINVVGSLLLALMPLSGFVRSRAWGPAFVGSGLLGGFTTMSAFSEQTRGLLASGQSALALWYVLASVGLALGAVRLGNWYVARQLRAEGSR